ncbi:uncharacterized protein LOC136030118 [Artemia franciscana]|uniref:uncharacterized protein LOC136030118 n=1 Tax=Artemia franciscana TaxID=6661 RepID=UPI0032DB51B7
MHCYMLMKSMLSMYLVSNFVLEPVSGLRRLSALNVKETVPQKRSAFLLDRLVMAVGRGPRYGKAISEYELPIPLKNTLLRNYGQENQKHDDFVLDESSGIDVRHTNSRILRCYFNAVSCF